MLEYPNCINLNYQIEYCAHLLCYQVIQILLIFFVYFLCILERKRLSQDGVDFGSANEAGAAGAVRNGDWRCNRLGDPETNEAELGLGR